MAWEPIRVFPITMAAAATLTSQVDLKQYHQTIHLVIPTMASASDFYLRAAETVNGDYRRLLILQSQANTATVGGRTYTIASNITNAVISIPAVGLRFLKIEASTLNSGALGFNLICGG